MAKIPVRKIKKTAGLAETTSLSAIDLFQDLPASCLRALEKETEVRAFPAGHVFFRPGQDGHALFLLEDGKVRTFRTSGKKKLIIAELKPPAVFGEMGCVGKCLYHCHAQATEPSRVRLLSSAQVNALLQKFPALTRRFLDLVSERFVHVLLDLESTSFRQLIPRIANLLLERAEGDILKGITHKQIAEHLRVYRESTTAALGELRKAGILVIDRKQIRILDRGRLERAARE